MGEVLNRWLGKAKLVQLNVPESADAGNPWLDTFGRSADDPHFEEVMREVARARAEDEPG